MGELMKEKEEVRKPDLFAWFERKRLRASLFLFFSFRFFFHTFFSLSTLRESLHAALWSRTTNNPDVCSGRKFSHCLHHSFIFLLLTACFALLVLLARYAMLTSSLACSLTPGSSCCVFFWTIVHWKSLSMREQSAFFNFAFPIHQSFPSSSLQTSKVPFLSFPFFSFYRGQRDL